jgi:hypothetical protein
VSSALCAALALGASGCGGDEDKPASADEIVVGGPERRVEGAKPKGPPENSPAFKRRKAAGADEPDYGRILKGEPKDVKACLERSALVGKVEYVPDPEIATSEAAERLTFPESIGRAAFIVSTPRIADTPYELYFTPTVQAAQSRILNFSGELGPGIRVEAIGRVIVIPPNEETPLEGRPRAVFVDCLAKGGYGRRDPRPGTYRGPVER